MGVPTSLRTHDASSHRFAIPKIDKDVCATACRSVSDTKSKRGENRKTDLRGFVRITKLPGAMALDKFKQW